MSAVRVARAATGRARDRQVRRRAITATPTCSWSAPDRAPPPSACPTRRASRPGAAGDTLIARFNDLRRASTAASHARRRGVAAVIVEPVVGNMGCVPPEPGFLEGLRDCCTAHGARADLRRGDDRLPRRARRRRRALRRHARPDHARQDRRRRHAAGGLRRPRDPDAAWSRPRVRCIRPAPLRRIRWRSPPAWRRSTRSTRARALRRARSARRRLQAGLQRPRQPPPASRCRCSASARCGRCSSRRGRCVRGTTPTRSTASAYARFFRAMLARDVLLPPSPFEAAFLSLAHDDAVIDETIDAATGRAARGRRDERSLPARLPARAGRSHAALDHAAGRPLPARVPRAAPAASTS